MKESSHNSLEAGSIPAVKLQGTLYNRLTDDDKIELNRVYNQYRLTHQELKKSIETIIDLSMWQEKEKESFFQIWTRLEDERKLPAPEFKSWAFTQVDSMINELKHKETTYDQKVELPTSYKKTKIEKISDYDSADKILGFCPVASEKTVCCNLRTLDAVKNCGFGCSYCAIQTMYTGDSVYFDKNFAKKLDQIQFDRSRLYHVGTGQSSDALMWGNSNGILEVLFQFARKWPNVLLEFKTKSKNVKYLLKADVPSNVFCSWSMNPDSVILNEEHLTATFKERLHAARLVADKGILVGFHFHPMIYFEGWREEYQNITESIINCFRPEEVAFISFGTLTFPKPIIKKIRSYDVKSKILQMPTVPNPEGKLTYPTEIKEQLFKWAYSCFQSWHNEVFFYLCMEEAQYWHSTFGYVYESNEEMEGKMCQALYSKLHKKNFNE